MRYMGGKFRIAKDLSAFFNSQLKPGQTFIDMFCGSCNVVSKIDPNRTRIANDIHHELIALHRAVQDGVELPDSISEEEYRTIRRDDSPDWLKGFVGFGCSFSGKWWGGYARCSRYRDDDKRSYCKDAKKGLLKKHENLRDVLFFCGPYEQYAIPPHPGE